MVLMPPTTPAPGLATSLAAIALPDADGNVHRLGDLWAQEPVVLAHLRHFG